MREKGRTRKKKKNDNRKPVVQPFPHSAISQQTYLAYDERLVPPSLHTEPPWITPSQHHKNTHHDGRYGRERAVGVGLVWAAFFPLLDSKILRYFEASSPGDARHS